MAEKKRGLRNTRVWKRFAAICMAVVMAVTMLPIIPGVKDVYAAPQGYSVTINFYDDEELKTPSKVDEHLRSRNNDGPFYLVVTAKGGPNDSWTTYAVKKIDYFDRASTTINFDPDEFRIDKYTNNDFDHESSFAGNDYNNGQGHYDTDKYHMGAKDSVVLYRVKDGIDDTKVKTEKISLKSMLAQFDYSDAAPAGYKFAGNPNDNNRATINLYKAYDTTYELRLAFDGESGEIAASDGYIAMVKVEHSIGEDTYFFSDNLEYDGVSGLLKIPVGEDGWSNNNGKPIAKERFTGNEKSRTIYLLKLKVPRPANSDLINKQTSQVIVLQDKEAVNGYTYEGVTSGDEVDESAKKEVVYDTLNFKAIPMDTTYNFLNVLNDSVNYGVTANSMDTTGHFESNFAVNSFTKGTSDFEPDLSGDGAGNPLPGNFLVGEISEGATVHFGGDTPATAYVITTEASATRVEVDMKAKGNVGVARTSKEEINGTVNGMINDMKQVSADLMSKPLVNFPKTADNYLDINTMGYPDGAVICIDGDKYITAIGTESNGSSQGVNITCKDDQLIVFNFDSTDEITIKTIYVNGKSSITKHGVQFNGCKDNNDADYVSRHVVWNLSTTKKATLQGCGGMYLLPAADNEVEISGAPPCGWIITAGTAHMGAAEFHFVYQGLTSNTLRNLSLKKTINDKTPQAGEEFTFLPEILDSNNRWTKIWVHNDVTDTDEEFTVENDGSSIVIPITQMKKGKNIIRITEQDKSGYKKNKQVFYAVFEVKTALQNGVEVKIPGAISYYTDYADGDVKGSKLTSTPTFKNEVEENTGYIQITKTIKGDVTTEDLDNLKFEIFDKDDNLVESVLLKDFTKAHPESKDVKDTYTYSLLVDPTKTYYVVETLTTLKGFAVTVKNEVGVNAVTGGQDTKTDAKTGEISVTKGTTTDVAFEDDYQIVTDVTISKASLKGTEIKGATLTLSGKTGPEETSPAIVFDQKSLVPGKGATQAQVPDGSFLKWESGETPTIVKGLSDGVYTLHEMLAPDGYKDAENVVFTIKDGVVTIGGQTVQNKLVVMTDAYKKIEIPVKATKSYKDGNTKLTLTKDQFTFELKDSAGKVIETKGNEVDGTVTFKSLAFENPATYPCTYTYTISEVKGNDTGTIYDDAVHTVEIVIDEKANGVGGLGATIKVDNVAADKIEVPFENTKVKGSLTITKTVTSNTANKPAKTSFKVFVYDQTKQVYVTDAQGTTSATKTSIDVPVTGGLTIQNLPVGKYTITEDTTDAAAVTGFTFNATTSTTSKDAEIKLNATNNTVTNGTAELTNNYTETPNTYPVNISKADAVTGELIAGAKIVLTKPDKSTVEWTSGTTAKTLELEEGTYSFVETVEPTGYEKVTTAIEFKVEKDATTQKGYKVTVTGLATNSDVKQLEDGTIVLLDAPKKGSLTITKTVTSNTTNKPAKTSFKVYVYNTDKQVYVTDAQGTTSATKTSIDVPVTGGLTIQNLPVGKYTVTEDTTDAAAVAGFTFNAKTSTTSKDAEIKLNATNNTVTNGTAELTNDYTEISGNVTISKKAGTAAGDELKGATLTLTGVKAGSTDKVTFKLTDVQLANDASFVSTVDGDTLSWISGTTSTEIKNLPDGTYTLHEVTAPDAKGFKVANDMYFILDNGEVYASDAQGTKGSKIGNSTIVMVDEYQPISVDLAATKKLMEGNTEIAQTAGDFQFKLSKKADSGEIQTSSNAADGTVTFTSISYNAPTEDEYVIEEVPGNIEGITYDTKTKYTVTVKITAGAKGLEKEVIYNNGTSDVDADKVVFTNMKTPDVGKLKIKKTVKGTTLDSVKVMITTGQGASQKYLTLSGTLVDAETHITVSTKDGLTIENVPIGEYTVTEVADSTIVANYTLVTTGADGSKTTETKIVEKGKLTEVELINSYERDKGQLTVTKTLIGSDIPKTVFKITIKNGEKYLNTSGTLVDQDPGLTITANVPLQISNVPTGSYTVTENVTDAQVQGYTLTANESATATVTKGQTGTAALTNEYTRDKGKLEIIKSFAGDKPADSLLTDLKFKVTGPDHFERELEYPTAFTNGKATLEDLPTGVYEVTERGAGNVVDGSTTYVYDVAGSTTAPVEEDVTKGGTAQVTITNKYTKVEKGSLTVTKSVTVNGGAPAVIAAKAEDKAYQVQIKNEAGKFINAAGEAVENDPGLTVSRTASITINDLPLGKYSISEVSADVNNVDATLTLDTASSTTGYTGATAVELTSAAKDATKQLVNVYTYQQPKPDTYKVYISKADALSGDEIAGATIELTKPDQTKVTWTSTTTAKTLDLEEGTYSFVETVEPNGYEKVTTAVEFKVEKDDTVAAGYKVTLITVSGSVEQKADGTIVLLDAPKKGSLVITKKVSSDTGNVPAKDSFKVTVYNETKQLYVTDAQGTTSATKTTIDVPLAGLTINNVPLGEYVVEEDTNDATNVTGFSFDKESSTFATRTEVKVDAANTVVNGKADLENIYTEVRGALKIKKTVGGDKTSKTSFKVTVQNAAGKYVKADGTLSDTAVLLDVKVDGGLTINNLLAGKYTITEDTADINVDGYDRTGGVTTTEATVAKGTTTEAELVNNYKKKDTGKISVHVTEEKSGLDVPDATVVITDQDGKKTTYKTNEKGEVVDKDGKIPTVPSGEYTVTVSDVPTGYDVKTGEVGKVVVPKDGEGHHEAVIATDRGGIIITVYDEETNEVVSGAKVVVKTPSGEEKEFVTDENGQITEYAKKDQFGNYTSEVGEYKYTVTEVPEGYRVTTGKEQTAKVETSKLTELEAKIAPKTGGLDIKVIDQKTKAPVPNATVEVTYPDGTVHEFKTDKDGMIRDLAEKKNGKYTAKVGTYKIKVTKVPEGYSVKTGVETTETIEVDTLKHHVAEIATATEKTVQTGDDTPIALLIMLMLMSAAGAAYVVIRKRREN